MNKNCEDIKLLLAELVYEEVDPATAREIYGHLEACASCRQRYAAFRAVRSDLQEWQPSRAPAGTTFIGVPATALPARRSSWWLRGLAVAASFVFGLVLTAAVVNFQISTDADGWTVSTSLWGRPEAAQPVSQGQPAMPAPAPADPGPAARTVSIQDLNQQELEAWLDRALAVRNVSRVAAAPQQNQLTDAQLQQVSSLFAQRMQERDDEERYIFSNMLAASEQRQREQFNATLTSLYENLEAEQRDSLYMLASELGLMQVSTDQRLQRADSAIDYLMTQVGSQPQQVGREEREQ